MGRRKAIARDSQRIRVLADANTLGDQGIAEGCAIDQNARLGFEDENAGACLATLLYLVLPGA